MKIEGKPDAKPKKAESAHSRRFRNTTELVEYLDSPIKTKNTPSLKSKKKYLNSLAGQYEYLYDNPENEISDSRLVFSKWLSLKDPEEFYKENKEKIEEELDSVNILLNQEIVYFENKMKDNNILNEDAIELKRRAEEFKKVINTAQVKLFLNHVTRKLNEDGTAFNKNGSGFREKIQKADNYLNKIEGYIDFFSIKTKTERNEIISKNERKNEKLINEYFFNKGVSQFIIHGVRHDYINQDNEKENGLKSKIDLDVWSAMQVMEMGGVKLAEGFNVAWIDPKEKLQYDEEGKPYFNSVESIVVLGNEGNPEKDSKKNIKHERKNSKLYLPPGTVIFDMGGTFGVDVFDGDIIAVDHHGEKNLKNTSTTKELFSLMERNTNFKNNFKENTKTENLEWLKHYIDCVTKIDNLDYTVNPDNWSKFNETIFALQKYFNKSNREIFIDLFKNYPNISFDGFKKEELDYVIAIGDKGYEIDKQGNEKLSIKNLRPLEVDGEKKNPDYFKKHELNLYHKKLITVGDLVEIQKRALVFANKAISRNEVLMHDNGLTTKSPFLGKTIIDEVDSFSKDRNPFGAVAAYGNGYDSYVILNLNGDQKNDIFISSKKNVTEFSNRLEDDFEELLGEDYPKNLVVNVRDTMVIVREDILKTLDIDTIRDIIVKALDIKDQNKESLKKPLEDRLEKMNKFLESLKN